MIKDLDGSLRLLPSPNFHIQINKLIGIIFLLLLFYSRTIVNIMENNSESNGE